MVTEIIANPETRKTVPFMRGHPLLGNLLDFNKDRLRLLRRMASMSDVCGMQFGPFPAILFNKPEYVSRLFVEHAYDFEKSRAIHAVFHAAVGDGLLSSEGDFHRHQRKLMAPCFQPRHIASHAAIVGHYSEQFQETWPDGGVIDINKQMTKLVMSITGKALFDADVFTETDELGAAMATTVEYASHGVSSLFLLPYSWPLPRNLRTRQATKILRTHIQNFIDERRQHPSKHNDLLSLLLQAKDEDGNPMSDHQLMAECMTLFGAGLETTSTGLLWTWYLLCQHPEIYQKVQHEVDNVLQGRTPTYDDLVQLPYCLQVFKEAMRIYPPSYFMTRRAIRDVEVDGYLIPKGGIAVISSYTLHRREEYFPEPETFDPDRFAPEREKELPRYAYIPFGAGPRICIGLHFGMMEGHLAVATLAQRTHLSLVPGQKIVPDPVHRLTTRPNVPVNVVVKKR